MIAVTFINSVFRRYASRNAIALICFAIYASAASAKTSIPSQELALARDYVFASCIIAHASESNAAMEAKLWAGNIVEMGHLSAESYVKLNSLAQKLFAVKPTEAIRKTNLQRCFEHVVRPAFQQELNRVLLPYN